MRRLRGRPTGQMSGICEGSQVHEDVEDEDAASDEGHVATEMRGEGPPAADLSDTAIAQTEVSLRRDAAHLNTKTAWETASVQASGLYSAFQCSFQANDKPSQAPSRVNAKLASNSVFSLLPMTRCTT